MNRRTFVKSIIAAASLMLVPFKKLAPEPTKVAHKSEADEWVRIGTLPRIVEDTDRWGMAMGTWSVITGVGWVTRDKWRELYEFENHDACGGKEETAAAAEWIKANPGFKATDVPVPLMKSRIKRSLIEQFNVRLTRPDPSEDVGEYVRMCAFFNSPTLVEWKPMHDDMVRRAQAQCDRMNGVA